MSESYVDALREAREVKGAAYLAFANGFARDSESVFAFFEDHSAKAVFLPHIRSYIPRECKGMCCQNKNDVIYVASKILREYGRRPKVMFFVDRDFDDYSNENVDDERVFVTTYYSVENYVVSEMVLDTLLKEKLCADIDDKVIYEIRENFVRLHRLFSEGIIPMMAWVATLRHRMRYRVNFDKTSISKYIKYSTRFQLLVDKRAVENFKRDHAPPNGIIEDDAFLAFQTHVKKSEAKCLIRGKFELWFFLEFIADVISLLKDFCVPNERKIFLNHQITAKSIFSIIGGSVGCDHRLDRFLRLARERFAHPCWEDRNPDLIVGVQPSFVKANVW